MLTKNTSKKQFIEKFKGDFNKVDGGCTVIHTKTIQKLNKIDNLAIYSYLCSKPPNWIINAEEISKTFGIGIKRVYKAFKDLIMVGLIEKTELREKGKFIKHLYYLNLSPLGRNGLVEEISTDHSAKNHLVVQPLGQNGLTYKEEKLPYKEKKIKKGDLNLKTKKPTQSDLQEHQAGVKGFEWVAAHII